METEKDRLRELVKKDFQDVRKYAGRLPNSFYRLIRSEEELGNWFLKASQNEISPDELKERTGSLQDRYGEDDEFDDISDELLDDCFSFVDEMHDYPGMQSFDEGWSSLFKKLAQVLLGESKREYFYCPCPGVQLKITYEKRK